MLSVKYQPAVPPQATNPEIQRLSQYVYQEFLKISRAFDNCDPRPHAIVRYDGSTQTVLFAKGVSGVTRVSAGVYDITIDEPLHTLTDLYGAVTVDSAGGNQLVGEIALASTNTTNIRVHLHKATSGTFMDGTFILSVYG